MPATINVTQQRQARRPRIAVTLGDQAGIGPELVAKLLNNPANRQRADIVLLADDSEFRSALSDAGGLDIRVLLNIRITEHALQSLPK